MAVTAIGELVTKVTADPQLMKTFTTALNGSRDPQDLVKLGAEHGFQFTAKEVELFFQKLLSAEPPKELSPSDLEQVAGGKDISILPANRLQLVSQIAANFSVMPTWMR
jgi:predicted ribosomally synthesized peptide with nif11-like leader